MAHSEDFNAHYRDTDEIQRKRKIVLVLGIIIILTTYDYIHHLINTG